MKPFVLLAATLMAVAPAIAQNNQPGAHFVENWDIDDDGAVSVEDIKNRRADVFFTFDADENGVLDAKEYVEFDAARAADMENNAGHGKGMRRASQGMTLVFNDSDENGEVSRNEFLDHSGDWFAMLDRNGDGVVTTADFGRQ